MVDNLIRLFESTATKFSTNGLGALPDAVICEVYEGRNGEFELEMEYPITGKRYSDLSLRRIVVAKPNPFSNPQPFRIYDISKPINGIVTVFAAHISYDMSGYTVSPFTASSISQAFSRMKSNSVVTCPFTFWTDKSVSASMTVDKPSSMRSLLGGVEGSILDVYGKGEYEFDEYNVKLHTNRGANRGVSIRYGKNLTDLKQEENCQSLYTGVYPYWYSEQDGLVQLKDKVVYATGSYDFVRIRPLDLSDKWQNPPTEAQLKAAATEFISSNNIGIPKVSLTVSFIQLAQSEEYKNYALLETVKLCDTVNVEFPELNVSATSKCIGAKYDVLTDRYIELELGEPTTSLASTIVSQNQSISEAPSKSFLEKMVDNATQLITGGLGGYVVIQSSTGDGHPDEILIMDTDNIKTATNVWRWNKNGLGYSSNGYNGPYTTAITADGKIVADFIATGELNGALIKAGTIAAEMLSIEYRNSVTNYATNAAENAKAAAQSYADGLKKTIDKEISDVNSSINDINNELETTVADGIITESEKAAIQKMLQVISKEKVEADSEYSELYNNSFLAGTPKSNLSSKYTAVYGTGSTRAYNKLVTSINAVINSTSVDAINREMTTYRTNYETYTTAVAAYQLAVQEAIDAIANAYATNAADEMHDTVMKETTVLIETAVDSIRLLCKTIEEQAMKEYVTDGSFSGSSFSTGWTASSYASIATYIGKKCAAITKSSNDDAYLRFKIGIFPAGTYRIRYKVAVASGSESATLKFAITSYATDVLVDSGGGFVLDSSGTTMFTNEPPLILTTGISNSAWTTIEKDVTFSSDMSSAYMHLSNITDGTTIYITDIEVLGLLTLYTEAQLTINSDAITAEVTRAKSAESTLQASIKVNADNIALKVSQGDFGTLIEQNYSHVRISWNKVSKYIQFEGGALNIYDSSDYKLMSLNSSGSWFYRDGNTVGKIGTNNWSGDSSFRGLTFDLEYDASYMSWATKDSKDANVYTVKLIYYHNSNKGKKGLHFACDTYADGCLLLNDDCRFVSYPDSTEAALNGSLCFAYGGSNKVRINAPDATIHVYNGVSVNFWTDIDMHSFSINNQSDARLKDNIIDTDVNGLDIINAVDLKAFDWIESGKHEHIGIIAQQLQSIAPELVKEDEKTGCLSIAESKLVYYCIKAIQELSASKPTNIVTLNSAKLMSQSATALALDEPEHWEDEYSIEEKRKFCDTLPKGTSKSEGKPVVPITIPIIQNESKGE